MNKKVFLSAVVPIIIGLCLLVLAAGLIPENTPSAFAAEEFVIAQTDTVSYCGKSYVFDGKFIKMGTNDSNALFESLSFSLNGEEKTLSIDDIALSEVGEIVVPGTYGCSISAEIEGRTYSSSAVLTISKKKLYVSAKINGESYCEVDEGEQYRTSVEYDGFVEGDDVNSLSAPAIIQREPKLPTTGFEIVPELAQSDLYEFVYRGATIVINDNPDFERTYKSGGITELVLRGSFSPCYTLEYNNIGISKSSAKYVVINEKIEKYFGNNSIFEEYEQSGAYIINMYLDGDYVEPDGQINVKIRLDSKHLGKDRYRVIYFGNDGSYGLLNATESDGYVSFTTSDFGEFVLLTPIEGANKIVIIAICVTIVAVVAIAILLASIFRRKY